MTELKQACADLEITLTSTLKGYEPKSESNDWPHFSWRVTLHYQGRKANFDYRTGVAHVNPPKSYYLRSHLLGGMGANIPADWQTSHTVFCTNLRNAWFRDGRAPIAPSVADVVSCLLSDCSSASNDTFESFCSEFGYDTDSRKALKTYKACQKILCKCVGLFGADLHKLTGLKH